MRHKGQVPAGAIMHFLAPGRHFVCLCVSFLTLSAGTLVFLVFALLITPMDASAQSPDNAGAVWITDWPESRPPLPDGRPAPDLDYGAYHLLPFIDTLAVHYGFTETDDRPSFSFRIQWTRGEAGIVNGDLVSTHQMPQRIVIESLDLLFQVTVDDRAVADFILPLDTIDLGTAPSMTFVDVEDVAWNSVFVDIGKQEARRIFDRGFRLTEPRILRIVFAVDPLRDDAISTGERRFPPTDPPDRTVCIPDMDVWVSWNSGRRRWAPPPGSITKADRDRRGEIGGTGLVDRTRTDRGYDRPEADNRDPAAPDGRTGEDSGRPDGGESGDKSNAGRDRRSGRSGGGLADIIKAGDDDDDDDEDRLLPAALAGAAAIGGIAVFGGTIGYFGSASKAPLGLMSGYVQPTGGLLLQVAINRQVFGKRRGPENLVVGATGFYDAFRSPIQPAVGVGVRWTEEETSGLRTEPSVALGLAGNFGRFVVLTAYDVTTQDFRFGFAVNFRHNRLGSQRG